MNRKKMKTLSQKILNINIQIPNKKKQRSN